MKHQSWVYKLFLLIMVGALAWPVFTVQGADEVNVTLVSVQDQRFPLVTLEMVVNDANGWPLTALTAENITVQEDKKPVPATAVTVENLIQQKISVVLGIDISIEQKDWPIVQAAAGEFINSLGPEDQLALLTFENETKLVQDFSSDTAKHLEILNELQPNGGYTTLYGSILMGLDKLEEVEEGRRALILISDSTDNARTVLVTEAISRAQASKIPVYIVGYGPKVVSPQFREFGNQTGNQTLVFNSANEVSPQLRLVALALHQGYRITFSSQLPADEAKHAFVVTVKRASGTGTASGQFTAYPGQVTVSGPGFDVTEPVVGRVFLIANIQAAAAVKKVSYWVDGKLLGEVTEVPYSLDLDTATISPGSHQLRIEAEDVYGNTGEMETSFIVAQPPPMTLKLTASATAVEQGNKLVVTVLPESASPIKQVALWVDGQALEADTAAPYVWEIDSNKYAVGDHVLQAHVEDSRGNVAQASLPVKITPSVLETGVKFAGVGFGWVIVAILVLLALILPLTMISGFKGKIQGKYLLEIQNLGNVTSRYDLQLVAEPAGALKANFLEAGQPLALYKMADTTTAVEAPAAQAQPAKKGFFNRRPAEKSPADKAAAEEKKQSAFRVFGIIWDAVTEIIRSLTLIVGGPVGNALRTVSTQATRAEYIASTTQRIGQQANKVGSVVTPGANQEGGQSGSQENYGSAQETTSTTALTGVSARPSNAPKTKVLPGEWAQTAEILAGEKTTLELVVTPLKNSGTQTYTFRLLSRATATPHLDPSIERTTVEIPGLVWWQSTLPWVLTLLLLGTALITSLFLLSQM